MVSFFFVTNRSQCFFLKKESLSLAWGVEKQAGALADLFDRAAVQLAALLSADPVETLHLGAIPLGVNTLALQREDGFDQGGLWCF